MFTVRASSDESDCNQEECAPEKEVSLFYSQTFFLFFSFSLYACVVAEKFRNYLTFFLMNGANWLVLYFTLVLDIYII